MSIFPLPVFEADADPRHRDAMTDEEIYARLEPPKTIVVKFGYMKLVAEFPYDGDAKPGCGSKLVARTHRGTELVEMLTTTCENAGCSKSVTRQEMMEFVENSGGRDFPFHTQGRILRLATIEDLNKQSALESKKAEYIKRCKSLINELALPMKLVEVELILGEELLTFYFMAQERVDFRELVRQLAGAFKTRIEMRQVGARDEARLVADYERCGQHCCCKNFLKVLKPVSMRLAKEQKATLDPLKISGRCGRLMCCLRYEDQTYKQLKASLPHRNARVGTSEGPGVVVDSKILVQLVLVRLEHDDREIAVPVEELIDPDQCPRPAADEKPLGTDREPDPLRGLPVAEVERRTDDKKRTRRRRQGSGRTTTQQQDAFRRRSEAKEGSQPGPPPADEAGSTAKPKRRRRRRRRRGSGPTGTP
ncbi:MAG: regulatory iron-sulfur-containing complex subunit RicT [Planctomycetota bacterium]|nr:regulatory iron-sulfur-containing complex subunit RicT [Planctomycetota bacterium]